MSPNTKRILIIIALAAAAFWFFILRSQSSSLYAGLSSFNRPAFKGPLDDLGRIESEAQGLAYDPLQLKIQFGLLDAKTLVPDTSITPAEMNVGDEDTFWIFDEVAGEAYQVTATLQYVGEMTLMYVDNQVEIDPAALAQAAQDFETHTYPRTRALFGAEASPGLDGDPRLTILHTPLEHAGGYYSGADAEPVEVNRFSNRREMFVIGTNSYLPGEASYQMILAHEFQHMIHDNQHAGSAAWFNEGLSMLAQDLNGFVDSDLALIYLDNPDLSLTDWSFNASETGEHYGEAQLFLRYFYQHYGGAESLRSLVNAGAGSNLQEFVHLAAQTRPDIRSFYDLFADFAVANLVNDPAIADGRFTYESLPDYAWIDELPAGTFFASVTQLGVDYLGVVQGPAVLEFDGGDAAALTGASPKTSEWMWWSGRGDSRVATLTRSFDLQGTAQATLEFSAWYEIEQHYDYAYVTVSVDGGQTWTSISGKTTTIDDPQGSNLGHGFTGVSGKPEVPPEQGKRGRWVRERMDLTPYAGQQVLVRFWMVNDPAYNTQGLLLDEIRIPEIGFYDGGEAGDNGWQAQGFVRTTGGIPQEWQLRLVVEKDDVREVRRVELDALNRARIELGEGELGVLVIMGASPLTDEPAQYQISTLTRLP